MRFWSASGNPDALSLVSDDPPELVRASPEFKAALTTARRKLRGKPGHVLISHHDMDPDDKITVSVEAL